MALIYKKPTLIILTCSILNFTGCSGANLASSALENGDSLQASDQSSVQSASRVFKNKWMSNRCEPLEPASSGETLYKKDIWLIGETSTILKSEHYPSTDPNCETSPEWVETHIGKTTTSQEALIMTNDGMPAYSFEFKDSGSAIHSGIAVMQDGNMYLEELAKNNRNIDSSSSRNVSITDLNMFQKESSPDGQLALENLANELLPSDFSVYFNNILGDFIEYPITGYGPHTLPTANHYLGEDGGYIILHTRIEEGSVYLAPNTTDTYVVGLIRVKGQYIDEIFYPNGYNVGDDITQAPELLALSDQYFPTHTGNTWISGDTGKWYGTLQKASDKLSCFEYFTSVPILYAMTWGCILNPNFHKDGEAGEASNPSIPPELMYLF